MKKYSIADLIANDFVHLGMEKTTQFQYVINFDEYINEFDDESKEYLLSNKDKILDAIEQNENVADMYFVKKDNDVDMVFYLDGLMDRIEKLVYNSAEIFEENLEMENVRDIAERVLNSRTISEEINRQLAPELYKDVDM